jgi:GTP pyrophosphokinase
VEDAFEYTLKSTGTAKRENGEPLVFHAIAVAEILTGDLKMMAPSVIATFLHETKKELRPEGKFSDDIMNMANDLDKISTIDIKTTELQAENFRKLIVSLSSDPRVILIKLADRLEIMRSLTFFPQSKQLKKSNETLMLYAPLAHQLGLYRIKQEMEDTALKYIEPQAYREIVAKLKTTDKERSDFIGDFLKPIEIELKKTNIKYEIKSRTKSIYSIWRKMRKQHVPFEGVYDVFAIRIITDSTSESEKPECWKVYSIVTHIYTPNIKRLRDWISTPRPTGYESLHITVDTATGKTVEVQIRSGRMDEAAESGIAAHWRYKGVRQIENLQSWLDGVKKLLNSPSEEVNRPSLGELKQDEILVFTPTGDLRQLPAGSSVLDFAFDIHSNLGSRCVGARVNGKNSTIKEKLKTGDVVEIMTLKNQTPKADWLNYVVTSKAKAKIKQRIREEETKLAGLGREILERRLKNWKLSLSDEILAMLTKHFKFKVITDLYAAIGGEKIDLTSVKGLLTGETKTGDGDNVELPDKAEKKQSKTESADYLEIDEKLTNVAFKLAKCCNPIFGDEIFGFVTIKEGIKIHRISCPNAFNLIDKYGYRIIRAKWKQTKERQSFQATLKLTGYEEHGMIGHINDVIMKDTGISVRSLNVSNEKSVFEARLQVYLHDKKQLDMLIVHLQQIKGVERVVRIIK